MIDSTDKYRYQPRLAPMQQMMRPQFDLGADRFGQPTQVAPPMDPPAMPAMRSVLKGEEQGPAPMPQPEPSENIRRMIEQLRGYRKPGMPPLR